MPCVYKIKIGNHVVHVGRSDTCKKHGGAEKVRKAIVNLLGVNQHNPSVPETKYWKAIRLKYRPNSLNIRIGIIKTNAIQKKLSFSPNNSDFVHWVIVRINPPYSKGFNPHISIRTRLYKDDLKTYKNLCYNVYNLNICLRI